MGRRIHGTGVVDDNKHWQPMQTNKGVGANRSNKLSIVSSASVNCGRTFEHALPISHEHYGAMDSSLEASCSLKKCSTRLEATTQLLK